MLLVGRNDSSLSCSQKTARKELYGDRLKKDNPYRQVVSALNKQPRSDPARYDGSDALCSLAHLNHPKGIAVSTDSSTLYIADSGNHAIRFVDISGGIRVNWAAKGRFEISMFKFKFPRARTYELIKARSRLYRIQILQVNTRWKALVEIYTMHSFAPFSNR